MRIDKNMPIKKRTFAVKNIVLIIIILVLMSLAYPFNAIFLHYSKTYTTENTPVEEYIDVSSNNSIQQSFVAMDKKLNKITMYFNKNKSLDHGTLNISIRDNDSVLKEWNIKSENVKGKVSLYPNCILEIKKKYNIAISTKDVNKYLAVGANGDEKLELNGNKQNYGLSIDYKYLSEINKMQTLAWWFICATLFLIVYYLMNVKKTGEIFEKIKDKKNISQIIVIADVIGIFLIATLMSSYKLQDSGIGKVFALIYVFALIVINIKWRSFQKLVSAVINKNIDKSMIAVLAITVLVRLFMIRTVWTWDAGEYYGWLTKACAGFDYTFKSVMDGFRLASHNNIGFALIVSIGEFFTQGKIIGIEIELIALETFAVYCIYKMVSDQYKVRDKVSAVAITLALSFLPLFCGTSVLLNPDMIIAIFFIYMIYAEYNNYNVLALFCSIIICNAKETGAIIIAVYLVINILIRFYSLRGKTGRLRNTVFSLHFAEGVVNGLIYSLFIMYIGGLSDWTQAGKAKIQTFGISKLHIINILKQIFVLNFQWIIVGIFVVSVVWLIVRKKRSYVFDRKSEMGPEYGSIAVFLALTAFSCIYIASSLYRYSIITLLIFTMISLVISYHIFDNKIINRTVEFVVLGLFIVQSVINVDPVTNKLFYKIDVGNKEAIFDIDQKTALNDNMIINYGYNWVDNIENALLSDASLDNDTSLILTNKASQNNLQISGNGGFWSAKWNPDINKRVNYDSESEDESNKSLVDINVSSINNFENVLPFICRSAYEKNYVESNIKTRNILTFFAFDRFEKNYLDIMNDYCYSDNKRHRVYENTIWPGKAYCDYYKYIKFDGYNGISYKEYSSYKKNNAKMSLDEKSEIQEAVEKYWKNEDIQDSVYADSYEKVECPEDHINIEKNDEVVAELHATDDKGKEIPEEYIGYPKDSKYIFTLGNGSLLPEVENALIGHRTGDEITQKVLVPKDNKMAGGYAGRTIQLKIKICDISGVYRKVNHSADWLSDTYKKNEDVEWNNMRNDIIWDAVFNGVSSNITIKKNDEEKQYEKIVNYYATYCSKAKITETEFAGDYLHIDIKTLHKYYRELAKYSVIYDDVSEKVDLYKASFDRTERKNRGMSFDELKTLAYSSDYLDDYVGR